LQTSWTKPDEAYEKNVQGFVEAVMGEREFLADLEAFVMTLLPFARMNSLAQTLLKLTAPGVPDFYQGTELWDFSLVDPDNRRPVDYERRRALLDELTSARSGDGADLAAGLLRRPEDDRLKLFATVTMLQSRRAGPDLFRCGAYDALQSEGAHRDHVFAFARRLEQRQAIVVVPRLLATLKPDAEAPIGETVWSETRIAVPETAARCYRQAFTGKCVPTHDADGGRWIRAADVFESFPIGFLEMP